MKDCKKKKEKKKSSLKTNDDTLYLVDMLCGRFLGSVEIFYTVM